MLDIYQNNSKNTCRYLLGRSGTRPLVVIGLNPSKADPIHPDQTIMKVNGFASRQGYDGFVMCNLYPQRTPIPDKLHKRRNKQLIQENLSTIAALYQDLGKLDILAAWGQPIEKRLYLRDCLQDIYQLSTAYETNWWMIGHPTKAGHPRHPSRAGYALGFQRFDIKNYLS